MTARSDSKARPAALARAAPLRGSRVARFFRDPLTRYGSLAVAAVTLIILTLTPLASVLVENWSQRDVELRARLMFHSIRDVASADEASTDLVPFFERLADDERVLALGVCDRNGELRHATKLMPKSVTCASLPLSNQDTFTTIKDRKRSVHVSAFRLSADRGHLLVLHDLSFAYERARAARRYAVFALLGIAVGLGLLAYAVVLALMRNWNDTVRAAVLNARHGREELLPVGEQFPIGREVRSLLGNLRSDRRYTDAIHVDWSPNTLQRLLEEELPGVEVLVVSNREPYIHNRDPDTGEITLQTPASGLVAALEPVMRATGGTWIAHGSGSADRDTVDRHDRIPVPPRNPVYNLRRVWLSDEEQDGYYYGLANEGLWPLCHVAFVRPTFREEDWAYYVSVNERFAETVAQEATQPDPIVLVQDYHFALLPRMIRNRLPRATIITFWHIPWPNAETFSICPWREAIIDGLLGSTIIGFHTQLHCNNFLEATDRFVESRIDREFDSVTLGGHETLVRPYPISIEWPPSAMAEQASHADCREAILRRYDLPADARIAVGVERFDYTKGILDRMRAVDDLLTQQPQWRGKLVFIQAAAPTRSKLGTYHALQADAVVLSEEINARHGRDGYQPIRLIIRHHEPREVYELFRGADMCIVSSLHDGMNLVAKEFVASRDDLRGVLILSSFAGASRELAEALIVNPYDTRGMGEAIGKALAMPESEQRDRMWLMREQVRKRNVYRWAAQMLLDAARLRRRERIIGPQSG